MKFTKEGEIVVTVTQERLSVGTWPSEADENGDVKMKEYDRQSSPSRSESIPGMESEFWKLHFAVRDTGIGISILCICNTPEGF